MYLPCCLQDRVYVSDQYKRVVLEHMSIEQLIDTLMINPTVHLSPSYRDTGLSASYTFQPLSNLVYTRDQQITGCKGIIMGRLRSSQRQLECELMRFCFRKLGVWHLMLCSQAGALHNFRMCTFSSIRVILGICSRMSRLKP